MKLNILPSCIVLSLLFLVGCAKAPSEVQKEIDNYNNAETIQNTDTVTQSIPEAINEARNFHIVNETNITIQNLILPDSMEMPLYNVRFCDGSEVNDLFTKLQSDPLLANNGGGTTINTPNDLNVWKNKKDYCFTAFPELDGINYYRNESEVKQSDWGTYYGQSMRMTETGCITLYADEQNTGVGSALQYSVEKRYVTNFLGNAETYTLCDGSAMSVDDAVQLSQQFCNDYFAATEKNLFEYQVNYLDVRKVAPNQYGYYVSLCRKDLYGNLFDATSIYAYTLDEFESRHSLIASPIHLWITTSNNIAEFEKNYTFAIDEINSINEIVSLESAVKNLSDALAQGKSYNFDTVELKYIFEVIQSDYIDDARNYANSNEYDDNMYGVVYSPDSIYAYGDYQINAIPYWVFTDINAQNTDTNCGSIFMVNAIDGSMRIENIDEYGNQRIHY